MNNTELKQIIENAPDGATHYSRVQQCYQVKGVTYGWQSWCDVNESWHQDLVEYDTMSLSDIRTILAQQEEIERLKKLSGFYKCCALSGEVPTESAEKELLDASK